MCGMNALLFLTMHNGVRLEELAWALVAIAGAVAFLGSMMPMGGRRGSLWLSGLALAIAGVLGVIAIHWGHA
jgi:hypothetical protein